MSLGGKGISRNKGVPKSEEHKKKIGSRIITDETREKMSCSRKEFLKKYNPLKGRKISEEHRLNIIKGMKNAQK